MPQQSPAPARPRPASPWVIDTRELGRRAGLMRTYTRDVPAPEHFGIDVLGVPEGDPVHLDVRLESVVEGVLATGTATAVVRGECSRCLDPADRELRVELTELFAYPASATDETTEEDEVSRIVDDLVDLEPVVRDAVILALPSAPLCTDDCAGLCADCGEKRAELEPDHAHETMDPRWAALRQRFGGSTAADEGE